MENASKALIIAGAILISILLISVGIIIMNAINEPVQSATDVTKNMGAETFNSKFTAYEGSNIDYNTAKSCMTAVKSTSGDTKIDLTGITSVKDLDREGKYDIEFTSNADTGYYEECNISLAN